MKTEILKQNDKHESNSPLSAAVFSRIAYGHIQPLPRWQFLAAEYGMWGLWALSIALGAAAFSVMLFVLMHARFSFHEATHEDVLWFFVEVLPYVWIGVFILMAIFAQYNLRHTRHGYRYPVWQLLISSIIFSFIGGAALHAAGIGYFVDTQAGKSIPIYPALEKIETRIWQRPEQGRMIGFFIKGAVAHNAVMFTDIAGMKWILNTAELDPVDIRTLYTKDKVRIIGTASSTEAYFHGCGVFPWVFNNRVSTEDLRRDREAFIARMSRHRMQIEQAALSSGAADSPAQGICAEHAAVLRIHSSMAH